MAIKLIIARSRTVDPTDEQITAEVLRLPMFSAMTDGISSMSTLEIRDLIRREISHVVCGESPGGGADASGKRWARTMGIEVISEPITDEDVRRWGKYVAPKMRNRRVAEEGSLALVFWDGQSNGSTDLVTRLVLRRKHVEVVPSKPVRRRRSLPAPRGVGRGISEPPENDVPSSPDVAAS